MTLLWRSTCLLPLASTQPDARNLHILRDTRSVTLRPLSDTPACKGAQVDGGFARAVPSGLQHHLLRLHENARVCIVSASNQRKPELGRVLRIDADIKLWEARLADRPESYQLSYARRELGFAVYAASAGLYGSAFASLRLFLELSFAAVYFSAYEFNRRQWGVRAERLLLVGRFRREQLECCLRPSCASSTTTPRLKWPTMQQMHCTLTEIAQNLCMARSRQRDFFQRLYRSRLRRLGNGFSWPSAAGSQCFSPVLSLRR